MTVMIAKPPPALAMLSSGVAQPTAPGERDEIVQVARAAGVFTEQEVETVAEMLDDYYADADVSGYYYLSCRDESGLLGFACWGPRDLASHGYDLYWIAVHPAAQGRGVARALMDAIESRVRARGGGWMWIETSSTPVYAPARQLYERCGYGVLATLPNFYRSGDGLIIYTKWLDRHAQADWDVAVSSSA